LPGADPRFENVDIRTDLYSLGATFYHMVSGRTPFQAKNLDAVLDAHLAQELVPPDHVNTELSAGLGEVIELMMAKDRSQRLLSPDDLIIDLECLRAGKPPKVARQRIEAGMLQELAQGEPDDEAADGVARAAGGVSRVWVAVLGGLLALSVVGNLILLLFRR
jgi:serine/threonine-protein kinase